MHSLLGALWDTKLNPLSYVPQLTTGASAGSLIENSIHSSTLVGESSRKIKMLQSLQKLFKQDSADCLALAGGVQKDARRSGGRRAWTCLFCSLNTANPSHHREWQRQEIVVCSYCSWKINYKSIFFSKVNQSTQHLQGSIRAAVTRKGKIDVQCRFLCAKLCLSSCCVTSLGFTKEYLEKEDFIL